MRLCGSSGSRTPCCEPHGTHSGPRNTSSGNTTASWARSLSRPQDCRVHPSRASASHHFRGGSSVRPVADRGQGLLAPWTRSVGDRHVRRCWGTMSRSPLEPIPPSRTMGDQTGCHESRRRPPVPVGGGVVRSVCAAGIGVGWVIACLHPGWLVVCRCRRRCRSRHVQATTHRPCPESGVAASGCSRRCGWSGRPRVARYGSRTN